MKTNFQMLQAIKEHYRKYNRIDEIKQGVIEDRELELITKTFELDKRTLVDLQNLRDFVVAVTTKTDNMIFWDMMSAITFVIDSWKIKLGGSV